MYMDKRPYHYFDKCLEICKSAWPCHDIISWMMDLVCHAGIEKVI